MAGAPFDVRYKAHAAGVVFVGTRVQAVVSGMIDGGAELMGKHWSLGVGSHFTATQQAFQLWI